MDTVLNIQNVSFSYDKDLILDDISLTINKGDFVGIIGQNGTGKSTLLKLLLGIEKANSGIVTNNYTKNVGYIEQLNLNTDAAFPATVLEIVLLGLYKQIGFLRLTKQKHKQLALNSLNHLGIKELAHKKINQLSGGQQQKVLIAKALVSNPDVLILDEPTTGIDTDSQKDFINTLINLNQKHDKTIIMVTHNHDNIAHFNSIYKINNKKITKEV